MTTAAAERAEPRREVAHYVLLALSCLLIIGSVLVSLRPITLANLPVVAPVGPVPPKADPARLEAYVRAYSVLIPQTDWRPALRDAAGLTGRSGVQVGYSLRQLSFLGLPFFAYPEAGYVLSLDDGGRYIAIAPLGSEGLEQIERETGATLPRFSPLTALRYAWGWLLPIMVALFVWFELRWQARRRAALGLI